MKSLIGMPILKILMNLIKSAIWKVTCNVSICSRPINYIDL